MHPKDEFLRAFVDRELSVTLTRQVEEHLAHCIACQKRLNELAGSAARVRARMDTLAPGKAEQPSSSSAAYARFTNHSRLTNHPKERYTPMSSRRRLWTALAIFAVLALVFTVTPARAWASSFLSLFRVQTIQVISFDPAAAQNAQNQLESNKDAIQSVFKDDLKITEHGKVAQVASLQEAQSKVGFTPRLPAAFDKAELAVQPGMNAIFTINQPKLQSLIAAFGVDIELPKSVDGKDVTIDVPDSVVATLGCSAAEAEKKSTENCTVLAQMPSPVINTPDGLDMPKMGEAMFRFLGMPNAEARALSQRIDWTTTLVLPVPNTGDVQYEDVKVDGVSGTFLKGTNESRYTLVWVKDGILYGLTGSGTVDDALKLVDGLQ
jgi:hypothetical protein